ncbi:hypothetical protein ORI20_15820 [Mycobacterium sp. CVI_P3]|uniref:Uncharacterized protein n=1 Tax=Mycobacterium pinniadriaticum TaxID=2994102 RepID=A0ABT3SF80_9MYCO|nr:hypothetical protein [Mycobacterium pinniadriaticum]MCX2931749.1 hypothetical protein [Mycobacterium pinniadriaticum]MCX2938176.1 hypothetical protein [Mycobacterium pinniadriaticum]
MATHHELDADPGPVWLVTTRNPSTLANDYLHVPVALTPRR